MQKATKVAKYTQRINKDTKKVQNQWCDEGLLRFDTLEVEVWEDRVEEKEARNFSVENALLKGWKEVEDDKKPKRAAKRDAEAVPTTLELERKKARRKYCTGKGAWDNPEALREYKMRFEQATATMPAAVVATNVTGV